MANINTQPDPYMGWSVWGNGNVTAHMLMTDTSGRWSCRADYGAFRIYSAAW